VFSEKCTRSAQRVKWTVSCVLNEARNLSQCISIGHGKTAKKETLWSNIRKGPIMFMQITRCIKTLKTIPWVGMKLLPKITDIKLNRSLKYLTLEILCAILSLKMFGSRQRFILRNIYICMCWWRGGNKYAINYFHDTKVKNLHKMCSKLNCLSELWPHFRKTQ
jgi:hypothetical protein